MITDYGLFRRESAEGLLSNDPSQSLLLDHQWRKEKCARQSGLYHSNFLGTFVVALVPNCREFGVALTRMNMTMQIGDKGIDHEISCVV